MRPVGKHYGAGCNNAASFPFCHFSLILFGLRPSGFNNLPQDAISVLDLVFNPPVLGAFLFPHFTPCVFIKCK